VILDNLSNSDISFLDRIIGICKLETGKQPIFYEKDCREDMYKIFSSHKIDGVIHFAALKAVGESVEKPLEYYDNNINSLLNILENCKKFKIKNLVFSSSCSLYGNVDLLPVNENTKISDPESPYAYTKLIGEKIIEDFCKITELNATLLRYFNPVGAHRSGMIGESPVTKPNNIMPVVCNSVKGDELIVFGNDYQTRDGSCIRDYVHVSDIANAHILALEWMMKNKLKKPEVFNLGSESGISVFELINTFERVNGVKVKYKIGNKRPGDVVQIYSDSTKAKKILGWEPKHNIDDMVESTWKWYQNLNN